LNKISHKKNAKTITGMTINKTVHIARPTSGPKINLTFKSIICVSQKELDRISIEIYHNCDTSIELSKLLLAQDKLHFIPIICFPFLLLAVKFVKIILHLDCFINCQKSTQPNIQKD
jgi:hypothetical protein